MIEEVEEILKLHPYLPKPKFVYLVEEPVMLIADHVVAYVRGATPKDNKDVIVLTPLASHSTVVHEIIHTLGGGEISATILGNVLARFREIFPPMIKRDVKYEFVGKVHPKISVYKKVD